MSKALKNLQNKSNEEESNLFRITKDFFAEKSDSILNCGACENEIKNTGRVCAYHRRAQIADFNFVSNFLNIYQE